MDSRKIKASDIPSPFAAFARGVEVTGPGGDRYTVAKGHDSGSIRHRKGFYYTITSAARHWDGYRIAGSIAEVRLIIGTAAAQNRAMIAAAPELLAATRG